MRKKPLVVFLTGGLGNQLFQLSNALSLDSERSIQLEWILGRPRRNAQNLPDIASFRLPSRVSLMEPKKYSKLASKTAGYLLRSGVAPKKWELLTPVKAVTFFLGNCVLSVYFRRMITVVRGTGIGYSSTSVKNGNCFIIGYFQSYRFTLNPTAQSEVSSLVPVESNLNVQVLKEEAGREAPIVVHFRFGDYKAEHTFGIPTEDYYRQALTEMSALYPNSKIWVFSDEESEARKVFPNEFIARTRWLTDTQLSSAQTLEIMRFGSSYVIANSTFSWWGAMLSKNLGAKVICPDQWFRYQNEPVDLIPPSWKRVAAWQ